MNKYICSECPSDYWPTIFTINAKDYNDGIEKLVEKYIIEFEDDNIARFDNIKALQEYLNEQYAFVISDLKDIEEL